jgi:hypothetical protein
LEDRRLPAVLPGSRLPDNPDQAVVASALPSPGALAQFLVSSAHRYDRSTNGDDFGAPVVVLYKDYFAGGAYSQIQAGLGAVLDGNDPDAASGTSSFRLTSNSSSGAYLEFNLASTHAPRDAPEFGPVSALRFFAKGQTTGQMSLTVKVLKKIATAPGYQFVAQPSIQVSGAWAPYVVNLASLSLAPKDIYAVQFQLPNAGIVRLDEVRLNTAGTDPFQLMQSYLPSGWAPTSSDPNTLAGRNERVYPNRAYLYDVAGVGAKALLASSDPALRALGIQQLDAVLATASNGLAGYFNERNSGFVKLADGSVRPALSSLKTVGDNAWLGLSLLDAFRLTGIETYLTRAREISNWIETFKDNGPLKGYRGGFDTSGTAVSWRSTEHNVDVFELNLQIGAVLGQRGDTQVYPLRAAHAAEFVIAMFDPTAGPAGGKFWTGTTSGDMINTSSAPLDAQLWPMLTLMLRPEYAPRVNWSRVLQYAETHLRATDGAITGFRFSSNSTAGKVWAEGVAHGIAVYQSLNHSMKEQDGFQTLQQFVGAGGGLRAVSSGTMQDSSLQSVYDAVDAIAPTAWAYLVDRGLNPFRSVVSPVATFGLYAPGSARFLLRNQHAPGPADIAFNFGAPNVALPIAGDWNNDRRDTVGLYNSAAGAFFLRNSHGGGVADIAFSFGPANASWLPVTGDWNGDGTETVGLYHRGAGAFFLRNIHVGGTADEAFLFGPANSNWAPIAGDWDGDGQDTVGLYNPTTGVFFLRNVHAGGAADITFAYGPPNTGWTAVVGDWDDDGMDTVGLYNPTASTFFLRNIHAGGAADVVVAYGPPNAGWHPIAGDWDGPSGPGQPATSAAAAIALAPSTPGETVALETGNAASSQVFAARDATGGNVISHHRPPPREEAPASVTRLMSGLLSGRRRPLRADAVDSAIVELMDLSAELVGLDA